MTPRFFPPVQVSATGHTISIETIGDRNTFFVSQIGDQISRVFFIEEREISKRRFATAHMGAGGANRVEGVAYNKR